MNRLSVLLVPLICSLALCQSNSADLPHRLESLVRERFEATKCPGLSVAVASRNQIVFSKAMGKADIEQNVAVAAELTHCPLLGSVSSMTQQGSRKEGEPDEPAESAAAVSRRYCHSTLQTILWRTRTTFRNFLATRSTGFAEDSSEMIQFSRKHRLDPDPGQDDQAQAQTKEETELREHIAELARQARSHPLGEYH